MKRAHAQGLALVVIGSFVLVVLFALSQSRRSSDDGDGDGDGQTPELTVGWMLCVSVPSDTAPSKGGDDEATWSYPLVFGLLASLSPADAASLGNALAESNGRWETLANPFVEDLTDGDPDQALARWLEHGPVAASVAVAAARRRYCGTDGFCVRPTNKAAGCPAGTRPASTGRELDRARFLAWPFGAALWMRAATVKEARDAVIVLRRRAAEPTSLIGLVLHADDDEATRERHSALREALVRHEVLRLTATAQQQGQDASSPLRVATPGDAGAGAGAFPADVGPVDVLVLPRVDVLRSPQRFADEVHAAAPRLNTRAR